VEAAVRVVTNQSQGPVVTASVSSRVKSAVIAETVAQPAKEVVEEPKEEETASETVKVSETQQVQTESGSREMAKGKKIKLTDRQSGKTYVMTEVQLKNLREAAKNEGISIKEALEEAYGTLHATADDLVGYDISRAVTAMKSKGFEASDLVKRFDKLKMLGRSDSEISSKLSKEFGVTPTAVLEIYRQMSMGKEYLRRRRR